MTRTTTHLLTPLPKNRRLKISGSNGSRGTKRALVESGDVVCGRITLIFVGPAALSSADGSAAASLAGVFRGASEGCDNVTGSAGGIVTGPAEAWTANAVRTQAVSSSNCF